jgi:hypothetical protein
MTLTERYDKLCATPSSINEHLPLLRDYASRCKSVAEFGVDIGQSTTAFLMGQPQYLCSYDVVRTPQLQELFDIDESRRDIGNTVLCKIGATEWWFHQADSRKVPISSLTDLLLIDSSHCYTHVKSELDRHHKQVRKYILMHDYVAYGEYGEAGPPQVGIMPAITEFLEAHPEWVEKERIPINNGLFIMERVG